MHKGEVVAISPRGKGRHPEYVTALIKSDELKAYKNNQKWLIVSDKIPFYKIKRGNCIFEVDENNILTTIEQENSAENSPKERGSRNHVKTFSQLTLLELEKTLNDFCSDHGVFATQVFQLKCEGKPTYDAIVHYKNN